MTLEQLRIFVAVAERQHVTLAARALNLAQPAASHAIAALESQHDTKLFDRVGRRIELTEAGHVFLAEARAVLARAEAAEVALSEFGGLKRGTLSVQASQTIESGMAELGFVEGAVASEHFASTPVARDQLVVVVGPEHPWGRRGRLTRGDLMDSEWILREPGSGTRSVFENALSQLGIEPDALRIQLELPSNEAVRAAVEAGLGATAISASVAAPSIEAGLLHQVDFPLPEREFHVLHHRERYRSRAAKALLGMLASGGSSE
jgi:DNA-binding transcriptional LysR family regulator